MHIPDEAWNFTGDVFNRELCCAGGRGSGTFFLSLLCGLQTASRGAKSAPVFGSQLATNVLTDMDKSRAHVAVKLLTKIHSERTTKSSPDCEFFAKRRDMR